MLKGIIKWEGFGNVSKYKWEGYGRLDGKVMEC